jgi:hypothetical protein
MLKFLLKFLPFSFRPTLKTRLTIATAEKNHLRTLIKSMETEFQQKFCRKMKKEEKMSQLGQIYSKYKKNKKIVRLLTVLVNK